MGARGGCARFRGRMQRRVHAVQLQFGVDGFGEVGLGKADRLCALDFEQPFKIRRRELLHHGIMLKVGQHFLAMAGDDIRRDQNKMQMAFVPSQCFAPDQQQLGFHCKLEQEFDPRRWNFTAHHAALIFTL